MIEWILKNRKLAFLIGLVIAAILLALIFGGSSNGLERGMSIKDYETKGIELVDYKNENFNMKIPKDWKVEIGGVDMYYAIHVFDPNEPANQIYIALKAAPFLKNYESKKFWQNYTTLSTNYMNSKMFSEAVILNPATAENFYANFNNYTSYVKNFEPTYASFNFPFISMFTSIESFESNSYMKPYSLDDKTIRATFENESGTKCEGLFMATMVSNGTYYVGSVDAMHNVAYNVIFISAKDGEFVNYEEVLLKSFASLEYTDSFVNTTNQNIEATTAAALKANATIQSAFDSYNSAWSNRQTTYDISSQKYSDATLGYERVYDTKTGEIYKAYNGFMDDYSGKRYQPITDDMYTKTVTGYIEK